MPIGVAVLSSGSVMNEGDTRNPYRIDSVTSAGVPAGVAMASFMKRATSGSVSGRRNALRPNVLIVLVRQVVPAVPAAAGSQVMNLAFIVAFARTVLAIALPTSL